MFPLLFWALAVLMLSSAASVVLNRNPVASALSLVASFLCLASLFVGLEAYFIAAVQVLVYAGAVMVLFLFIIMLLDLKSEARRSFNLLPFTGGIAVTITFAFCLYKAISSISDGPIAYGAIDNKSFSDVHWIGENIFTHFNLQLQIVACLILVATVGVVAISQKEPR